MNKEEAIKWLKAIEEKYIHGGDEGFYEARREAICMAIAALQAQQQAEKNEPLTQEELREIGRRCEGVYVAHIDGRPVFRDQKYCAAVLDVPTAFGQTVLPVHAIYGDKLIMWGEEYGKTWLAYRRKPGDNAALVHQMTNADRIRSMSDEELAIMLAKLRVRDLSVLDRTCQAYSGRDVNDNLDWLKQPAEVEE